MWRRFEEWFEEFFDWLGDKLHPPKKPTTKEEWNNSHWVKKYGAPPEE